MSPHLREKPDVRDARRDDQPLIIARRTGLESVRGLRADKTDDERDTLVSPLEPCGRDEQHRQCRIKTDRDIPATKPRVSLPPRHSRCVAQRANGDLGTHVQSKQQDSEVEETWQLRFKSNDSEKTGICCYDVCWVARCRPWKGLRILPVCGQVSSIIISLCCPRNLTVVLLRSVTFWQKSSASCIGSNSVRLAIPCTLTHLPSLLSL